VRLLAKLRSSCEDFAVAKPIGLFVLAGVLIVVSVAYLLVPFEAGRMRALTSLALLFAAGLAVWLGVVFRSRATELVPEPVTQG
jgi:hypothetical protein